MPAEGVRVPIANGTAGQPRREVATKTVVTVHANQFWTECRTLAPPHLIQTRLYV